LFFIEGDTILKNDEKIYSIKLYKICPQLIGIILKLIYKRESYNVIHIHGDWSLYYFKK